LLLLFLGCITGVAQERKRIPISIEDILRQQVAGVTDKGGQDLNERLRAMLAVARYSQDYLLGSGDVIEVTVFGIEDLKNKELVLDSEGKISLPFINEVQLLGLTARESEVKIATLYEASVLKNPQVSIAVKEYRSQFINVVGAVVRPGTYQLTRRVFLVDALAMAGGLVPDKAEAKVYVHRAGLPQQTGEPADAKETLEIDLLQLLEKGDVSLNVPIYAGDVVSVPERLERFFYVLGDVSRGGAFEIKRGEQITLRKALASAGGLLGTAKAGKTIVMRQNPDGITTSQIPVDASKVLSGKVEDMVLNQNDVVFVPGSSTKRVGRNLLNSIAGILSALVYAGIR
jgi:polysaccharide export outer membrane protein